MTIQVPEQIGMPLDEFIEEQEKQPFELIDGERIFKMSTFWKHSWLIRYLFRLMDAFVLQNDLGEIFQETTYAQMIGKTWVKGSRIPDVMFFASNRVEDFLRSVNDEEQVPFAIAPDLTIEVLSPSELATDINKKVTIDLQSGVRLIWVIDPIQQKVMEYYDGNIKRFTASDILDGKDVLTGFTLSLADLFAERP